MQDWLKDQEELSKERVQQQKQQWVQSQLQQQQLQYAADIEAIDEDLHEKLQELEKKKSRGVKASAAVGCLCLHSSNGKSAIAFIRQNHQ